MIVEKKKQQTEVSTQEVLVPEKIQIPKNGLIAVYHAVKDILEQVRWDYYDENSEKIFKTVMMNRGQFERIVRKSGNTEYAIAFPACFVEFVNWRYLVQQQRINEGRADMQIKFIMNRLNNQDPDTFNDDGTVKEYRETEVEFVAQIINQFIQELKYKYPALSERINLKYIDPLESFQDGLQPCWITYEVWFREESIYATRWLKQTYIVFPPYTNHGDQEPEHNWMGHTNYDHPEWHEDHSKFLPEGTGNPEDDDDEKPYDPGFDTDVKTDTTPETDAWNGRMEAVELDRDGEVASSTGNLSWGENLSDEQFRDYLHLINDQLNDDE
jgi:hypothetical protein